MQDSERGLSPRSQVPSSISSEMAQDSLIFPKGAVLHSQDITPTSGMPAQWHHFLVRQQKVSNGRFRPSVPTTYP
jgi:hypothetical protein